MLSVDLGDSELTSTYYIWKYFGIRDSEEALGLAQFVTAGCIFSISGAGRAVLTIV